MNKPLQFSVKDIDGNVKNLSDYLGKTVLVVNVTIFLVTILTFYSDYKQ
jgi:glutathione peroxidase-family protein